MSELAARRTKTKDKCKMFRYVPEAVGVQERGMRGETYAERGRPLHLPGGSRGMRRQRQEPSKGVQRSPTVAQYSERGRAAHMGKGTALLRLVALPAWAVRTTDKTMQPVATIQRGCVSYARAMRSSEQQ